MTAKPVILRRAARIDLESAVDYYAVEAGEVIADKFADTYISAIGHKHCDMSEELRPTP
jgi:hypothetical protein